MEPRLEETIAAVRLRIDAARGRAGREDETRLVGITKLVPPETVRRAFAAGLTEFGENYVRDLEEKRAAAPEATWHFVGRLQSNKVRRVLESADMVQTLEPGRAAERLGARAADKGLRVLCLVEVDFTGSRVGVALEETEAFLEHLAGSPSLDVRGLMTVPPLEEPPRPYFAALRELRDRLRDRFPALVELSMGMSADYEAAVEEGATMVRVGTAIFGPRP